MDTHLSDLFAQRTKLTEKLFTESLGACEWTLKSAPGFRVSAYLSKLLPTYQSNYKQTLLLSPTDPGICLFLHNKEKKWALKCYLKVIWFGIVTRQF